MPTYKEDYLKFKEVIDEHIGDIYGIETALWSHKLHVAGRAARNTNGRVILFGDRMTDSMKYLIEQTESRRKIQELHNKQNNIVPKSIVKDESSIKSITLVADQEIDEIVNDEEFVIDGIDEIEKKEMIKEIEKKMLNYAKEFQFEKAAILRDQIKKIKKK